ncbi:MAG: cation/H(+) antiporter [Candidatus Angelobacter sp. Gp1-AA117]|nr:MAG: cation/H(+) antiporter [Candidatus Angelobacter sp. Gp1-AA117]
MSIAQLLLSVGTIVLVTRLFGWLFERIGQPCVVGEMTAGIVLGPSVLGYFFPGFLTYIFPSSSLTTLTALSQLGILLFMFVVGLEVDLNRLLKSRAMVVLTSNFSILMPFVMGIGLARLLYSRFAGPHVPFLYFAMFVGTAMSVTAFPVLARILQERNLLRTDLGRIAISCAAIDDASAWLLLATLTAMVHSASNWSNLAITLAKFLVFVSIMLFPVRYAIAFIGKFWQRRGLSPGVLSVVILLLLASSWITEQIGVHALFGAFIAGLIMPKHKSLVVPLREKIESLTLVLLLPLFFALTGLRTRIDLISGTDMWLWAFAIIGVATLCKFAGASATSYILGMKWKDSVGLGILMNTRGLVELVVLTVGLDLGILSPALFTMMVTMALVTTFMATPLLVALKIAPSRPQLHQLTFDNEVELVS